MFLTVVETFRQKDLEVNLNKDIRLHKTGQSPCSGKCQRHCETCKKRERHEHFLALVRETRESLEKRAREDRKDTRIRGTIDFISTPNSKTGREGWGKIRSKDKVLHPLAWILLAFFMQYQYLC